MKDYPLESMIRDLEILANHPDMDNPDGVLLDDPTLPIWFIKDDGKALYSYMLKALVELQDFREKETYRNRKGLYLL